MSKLLKLPDAHRRRAVSKPYQRSRRLTNAEVESLVTAYLDGNSVYALGERFGINRKSVALILKRHGVAMRYRKLSTEDKLEARRLREAGWTYARLAELFHVHQASMWNMLKRGRRD